jgi:predicted Zn-dependent peptidase
VLDNGIKVLFYPRKNATPVFSATVVVRVGGVDEPVGLTGISHMFEHMAFKGTKIIGTKNYKVEEPLLEREEFLEELKSTSALTEIQKKELADVKKKLRDISIPEEFSQLLSERGVKKGGDGFNASTDKEFTKYYESLPKSSFEFWSWIGALRLKEPIFRQFFEERDVVLEERRMRYEDDPLGKLYEMLLGVAYRSHPYRNPVIGYKQDIESLTPTKLKEFHKKYYVGHNIAIAIVGDVDPTKDIEVVKKYFGKIPAGKVRDYLLPREQLQEAERNVKVEIDRSDKILIAYHKPVFPDKNDPPLTLLGEILSGSNTSRLISELIKSKKVASEVDYFEAPGSAYPNLFCFAISPNKGYSVDHVHKLFDSVIDKFLFEGPTQEELQIAKRKLALDFLSQLRSNYSMSSTLATSALLYSNWSDFMLWYKQMAAVTVADIRRVALTYLVPSNRTVGYVGRLKDF